MGILGDVLGGLVGGGAKGIVDGVAGAIDRFVETDDERRAAEILKRKMEMEPARWQAEINKVEAGHRTLFVAGWRPFVGWNCAIGLAYNWYIRDMIVTIALFFDKAIALKPINIQQMVTVLFAMLGIAGYRTIEKAKGLTS